MANFPQKRGHQHKQLKCLKNRHQTLYLEINTRFPIRQNLLQQNLKQTFKKGTKLYTFT